MASKYTERITIPVTKKQKEEWKQLVEVTQYNSIAEMVRDIMEKVSRTCIDNLHVLDEYGEDHFTIMQDDRYN